MKSKSSEGKGICCLKCSGYFEHRIGSHSDDRGGDSDYPCYCNQNDCKNPDCECHNQKSLDKKKPSELFEGEGSTLHQSFVEAVERDKNKPNNLPSDVRNKVVKPNKPKELDRSTKISIGELNKTKLVDEITAKELAKTKEPKSWQIDKGAQEAEDKAAKNFYDKAVKPKELDWEEKTYKFIKNILLDAEEKKVPHPVLISQIFSLLTQQRTELLEEIGNNFYEGGWKSLEASYYNDLKEKFIENFTNLLNKKDE